MSTPQPSQVQVTVQAHPDDFQNVISGILTGLQAFQLVAPFILQLVQIEKGQPAVITINPPQAHV